MYKVKVEHFEGPFDLLLQLIEENKLDITKVSLAEITEEYIRILEDKTNIIPATELADFLVVAAKLLLIKSKALMPYLVWDEEEEKDDLGARLRMYKEYFEASKVIHKILLKKKFNFYRERFLVFGNIGFHPPKGLTLERLALVFREIVEGLTPFLDIPKAIIRRTVNIQDKIKRIQNLIFQEAKLSFTKLLKEAKDKTEVIVSFLALLELMKQREITVSQNSIFDDIIIEKI